MNRLMALLVSIGLGAVAGNALTAERTLVLIIENMDCKTCTPPLAAAIDKADGVLRLDRDATTNRVTVVYEDSATDWSRIASAAVEAGYQARRVADAPVITVRPDDGNRRCILWDAPSRRDTSRGVIHRRTERGDRRCLIRSRRN